MEYGKRNLVASRNIWEALLRELREICRTRKRGVKL